MAPAAERLLPVGDCKRARPPASAEDIDPLTRAASSRYLEDATEAEIGDALGLQAIRTRARSFRRSLRSVRPDDRPAAGDEAPPDESAGWPRPRRGVSPRAAMVEIAGNAAECSRGKQVLRERAQTGTVSRSASGPETMSSVARSAARTSLGSSRMYGTSFGRTVAARAPTHDGNERVI
jgi:hypothetical protein